MSEWKEDFKGFVEGLDIPRDDYKGIMEYIDEVPSAQPSQIHCYECKHYDTQECMGRNAFYGLKDDDYCSWAELEGEQE